MQWWVMSLAGLAGSAAIAAPVELIPAAKEVTWGQAAPIRGGGVILLAPQADGPERHAAEMLQRHVQRRFGQKWAIESAAGAQAQKPGLRVLLGRAGQFQALDDLLSEQKVNVPEQADGYALIVTQKDGVLTAGVAGRNGLGVIYGQDTLFQLLRHENDGLVIHTATIRDWPTIPVRGRPHPHFEYFLETENFDALLTARLNFIDLRDSIYAFEPGAKFNREQIARIIRQARERGLLVFSVVNCGVAASEYDTVIATFKEFLDLGANGLWLSFDDKGPGEAPQTIVSRVLALGRERGITGDAIAITPPKGAYQVITQDFNRKIAKVPGMERALWFWTRIPCAEDAAQARSIGLEVLPSWWHNWPRFRLPAFSVGERTYSDLVSMRDGWHHPRDEELRAAGAYVHAVLPWDGWRAQQHYLLPAIGWWSWRPEAYDFDALRRRACDVVYGPAQAQAAAAFDDTLQRARRHFLFSVTHSDWAPLAPPLLRSQDSRAEVVRMLEGLRDLAATIRAGAANPSGGTGAGGSLLDPALLERDYLGPMQREVDAALVAAKAPFPEYEWQAHQRRVLERVYDGDLAGADREMATVRPRLLESIQQVEAAFANIRPVSAYVKWWRARAAFTGQDWKALIADRQQALLGRIVDYDQVGIGPLDGMLAGLNDPPVQLGTGAWKRRNRVLATVLPEPREMFWGDWIGGLYEHKGHKVAVFALQRHVMMQEGAFSELPLRIPISGRRDCLALCLFLADVNKESYGLGYAKWRWAGTRWMRLLWKDQEIWRADLGIPRMPGEWFVVPLPALPADLETLELTIRVEDVESAKNNFEIVYLGPVRLLELDRSDDE